MRIKERYKKVFDWFQKNNPVVETELQYTDPFGLAVAVILSAQCTDKRVNMITPALLKKYPDPQSMANAEVSDVFTLIRSCSYPNNKAKHLVGMAKKLLEEYRGKFPEDITELQKLSGIGRKSANVIMAVAFKKPAMAVDTHVFRVSERIGLTTNARNPYQAEMQLVKHIPENLISSAHHWLILHGRYICRSRKPACDQCGISKFCRFYSTKPAD